MAKRALITGITGQDGDQVLELDSTGNATVAQVIAGPGLFELSFLYADRLGGLTETFDVYWNSVLLASFNPSANPPTGAMQFYSTLVAAGVGPNELAFVSTGTSNSLGALIDDVQLNHVPDGGATLVLLGFALGAMAFIRRQIA